MEETSHNDENDLPCISTLVLNVTASPEFEQILDELRKDKDPKISNTHTQLT